MSSFSSSSSPFRLFFFLLVLLSISCRTESHVAEETGFQLMGGSLEWPSSSIYYGEIEEEGDDDGANAISMVMMSSSSSSSNRRTLYGHHHQQQHRHYYISYEALSANRIPCPARSGRSYYTHNCYKARGPAHPYVRGCSTITRCRM